MKRSLSVLISLLLCVCLLSACGEKEQEVIQSPEPTAVDNTVINIGVLAGPTGMGMSKLWCDDEQSEKYNVSLFSAPTDVTGLLINGELDIAALPTNLASTLYNKTKGQIKLVCINTLCVLYVLEKGDTVHSISDLEGKTVYSSGQSSTPQYALDYVLKKNGVNCNVEYLATHAELAANALAGKADIILIPEPQVSNILTKDPSFRIALDFNDVWNDAVDNSAILSMGCLAVRKDFAENHPQVLENFMSEYSASVEFVNNNIDAAAEMIASKSIVPSAQIAAKAIPNAKIVAITGDEMKQKTMAFLNILYESDASSIGGALPGDDFFC